MKNDVMRGTRAPSCFLSFLSLFLKNEKRLLLWRLRTKYGIIKRPSGTMCYPSYNWLNSCLTVWQTLRHFGENDTFSVKAGCKFLVASSFSAQFTPLARPNYKHGWPRTASEAERQSICSKKRTWCCCYRRWHYHLVVVNQWQNSGSTKKPILMVQEIWTVSFFLFFRELSVFCTWENGFRTAQSLGEKFDRKSPLPTNHNLHLDCKSWQNLDKHLCLYTVWPEFVFRSSAF